MLSKTMLTMGPLSLQCTFRFTIRPTLKLKQKFSSKIIDQAHSSYVVHVLHVFIVQNFNFNFNFTKRLIWKSLINDIMKSEFPSVPDLRSGWGWLRKVWSQKIWNSGSNWSASRYQNLPFVPPCEISSSFWPFLKKKIYFQSQILICSLHITRFITEPV